MSAEVIPLPARRPSHDPELTKKQLAAMWGVSTRWIELQVRDDGLPSCGLFAGKRRFRLSEVERWRRERTR